VGSICLASHNSILETQITGISYIVRTYMHAQPLITFCGLWLVAYIASHSPKPRFVAAARSVTAWHPYNGNVEALLGMNRVLDTYIRRFTSASLELRIIVPRIFISPYRYWFLSIGRSMGLKTQSRLVGSRVVNVAETHAVTIARKCTRIFRFRGPV
jgi:hypothetical protein